MGSIAAGGFVCRNAFTLRAVDRDGGQVTDLTTIHNCGQKLEKGSTRRGFNKPSAKDCLGYAVQCPLLGNSGLKTDFGP